MPKAEHMPASFSNASKWLPVSTWFVLTDNFVLLEFTSDGML